MNTATLLLTGFLLSAAPEEADTAVPPRLEKGLEILWKGRFQEAILFPSKSFRNYDFTIQGFVIDVCEKGSDVGLMMTLTFKPEIKVNPNQPLPHSIIRLQVIRVGPRGNVSLIPAEALDRAPEKRESVPVPIQLLQGLPALEVGMFLALPEGKLKLRQAWNTAEENRPPLSWKLDSVDYAKGRCFKVLGEQQSPDFEKGAITRPQWRRSDTLWVADRTGYAVKVERSIEKRTPESGGLCFRSKLNYDYAGQLKYNDQVFAARKEEIVKAAIFGAELQRLLEDERKGEPEFFSQILKQIDRHEQTHLRGGDGPYRAAILSLKRRAEAAKNGHIPPALPVPETTEPSTLTIGSQAPDFITAELTQKEQVRLSGLQGKPVVLLYYQPSGQGAKLVLKLAQNLFATTGRKAYIMSVAVGDPEQAFKQRDDWKLTIPILAGKEVYKLHGVTATPEIAILDERGVVQKLFIGWTDETAESVRSELEKWVK